MKKCVRRIGPRYGVAERKAERAPSTEPSGNGEPSPPYPSTDRRRRPCRSAVPGRQRAGCPDQNHSQGPAHSGRGGFPPSQAGHPRRRTIPSAKAAGSRSPAGRNRASWRWPGRPETSSLVRGSGRPKRSAARRRHGFLRRRLTWTAPGCSQHACHRGHSMMRKEGRAAASPTDGRKWSRAASRWLP